MKTDKQNRSFQHEGLNGNIGAEGAQTTSKWTQSESIQEGANATKPSF